MAILFRPYQFDFMILRFIYSDFSIFKKKIILLLYESLSFKHQFMKKMQVLEQEKLNHHLEVPKVIEERTSTHSSAEREVCEC